MAELRQNVRFALAVLFVFSLLAAIADGGRGNWIRAAVFALLFALTDWRRPANR